MAGAQIGTSVTILSSGLKGWQAVTLTNFSGSAVSAIAAGSTVEIAGAFFIFGTEESITGFSAITTAATAYVALTPSGTAGSQIVNAAWTSTAPTWSESKQGWYASAASVVRYIGGGTKTGTTALEPKWVFSPAMANASALYQYGNGTAYAPFLKTAQYEPEVLRYNSYGGFFDVTASFSTWGTVATIIATQLPLAEAQAGATNVTLLISGALNAGASAQDVIVDRVTRRSSTPFAMRMYGVQISSTQTMVYTYRDLSASDTATAEGQFQCVRRR